MFYFLRHPETTWNIEGLLQGSMEGELTSKSKIQTKKVIKSLSITDVTHIYHAHNKRTKFVADLLKKKYPAAIIHVDKRLNERNCGIYEGMPTENVFSKDKSNTTSYEKKFEWKPTKGESHKEVSKRTESFIKYLRKEHNLEEVFCITSSGVIRNLLRTELNLSLEKMYGLKIKNLELIKLN